MAALQNPVIGDRNNTKKEIILLFGRMERDGVPSIPKLVSLLDDKGSMVALRVAQALEDIGGPEAKDAVPGLIRFLTDKKDHLREQAADTLGAIGPAASAAVPLLIEKLHNDLSFRTRGSAAEALVKIAPADIGVRKELITAMKHPDKSLQWTVTSMVAYHCPPTREWVNVFLDLYASKHHSLGALEALYYRVDTDEKTLFPQRDSKKSLVTVIGAR